jgi:DNA (cytosine-5)-methyltransferase 1
MEVKVIGQMDNTIDHTFESANRVYDVGGVSPTINTCGGGGLQPKILEDKTIVAMRGRNPDDPSDRTAGSPTEQRLEPNSQGICNTLTSVQKDNLVMEKVVIDDTYANRKPRVYEDYSPALRSEREGLKTIENVYDFYNNNLKSDGVCGTITSCCSHNGSGTFGVIEPQLVGGIGEKWGDKQYRQGNRVYDSESVAMAVTSQPLGNMGGNSYMYLTREPQYRIRKLTPRECWRLMDFTDEDFEKAAHVNSNTQLYKQAGNSIIRNVLVAILGQLIEGKEDAYRKV